MNNLSYFKTCKVCSCSELQVENEKYDLAKCANCGLIFCRTIFSKEQIKAVYDELYNKSNRYQQHDLEFQKLKRGQKVNIGRNKSKILSFFHKEKNKKF